nr:fibrous sheath CABYR-binding protein-like [Aegilops tauschii subsp. strangulata]
MSGHRDPCRLITKEMPDAEVANLILESDAADAADVAAVADGPYEPDRAVSYVDDPDLGAATLEENATGGVYGADGSEGGGGLESWPDEADDEDEPRHARAPLKVAAGSSTVPTAQAGSRKRKQGAALFGSAPKKTKNPAAATRRKEAAAKVAKFQRLPKAPPLVSVAPLSLEKSAAASIVGSAQTSSTSRRINPAADLWEAKERNLREARTEQEAARREKAEADKAEAAALQKLAEAEAATTVKKRLEEAARRQEPLLVVPLSSAPPPPDFVASTGGAGDEHSIMEREGGDVAMPDVVVPPPPPSVGARDKPPADLPVPPAGNEMVTGLTPEARTPSRRRPAMATSAPRPQEAVTASSSIPDAEATSAAPACWTPNRAILDVQAKLRAEADALKSCNKAFLESRTAIRNYHNLRAAAFNSKVQELDQRTADLSESRRANAALQQQLGEANTALHAKEVECSKLTEECDRMVTQLAEQAEPLKQAQKEAEDREAGLLAEFATERSAWTDKEAMLTSGFHEIKDIVDDFFPGHSVAANQAIEADREQQRAEGAQIAANAPRTLSEQFISIQRTTFRLEAQGELAAMERALITWAAAIADYTDTSVFIPELTEEGVSAQPEWFVLDPEGGEDSAEVIDSSDEGEEEEDEEDEEEAPEVGADGQPQLDLASSNEPCPSEPTADGGDQAETGQLAAPPTGATDSAVLPNSSDAP